jgi:SAM-dependent methyltransferase
MSAPAIDYHDVPIVINNFNRQRDLIALVEWLRRAGQRDIVILDNASTLPGLDDTYRRFADIGVRVMRLGQNGGARALWTLGPLGFDTPFVYTDSDIVPDEDCPLDLVGHLLATLDANPHFVKIGVGLRIDDLPDHYAKKAQVGTWEAQFWRHPVGPGLFLAPVDTTFAVYRGLGEFALEPALRSGRPYRARHLGWYVDSGNLTGEDAFYLAVADPAHTNWSGGDLPDLLVGAIEHERRTRPLLLNLNCGDDPLPGWINADDRPRPGIDIVFALDGDGSQQLKLPNDAVDGIFLKRGAPPSAPAMRELYRVAKPGGKFILRQPAAGAGQVAPADFGDWDIARRDLVGGAAPEMIVELRAVKPPRARPIVAPPAGSLPTPVDLRSTFP